MMGYWAGTGVGHWIVFAVFAAILLYPLGRILGRLGLSPFWSVLAFVPLANLIGLWLLAFIRWPARP